MTTDSKRPALTIDEQHVYRLSDGRVLPGVTTVIRSLAPGRTIDPWYLQRGSAVHLAVHLEMTGKLDWGSVDQQIKGRVEAALRFVKDAKLHVLLQETALWSHRYMFAGTLDLYALTPEGTHLLVDWKGSLEPHCEPQMGAYSLLLEDAKMLPAQLAVAVETHDDGSYKCRYFQKPAIKAAQQTFLSMLTVHNWKQRHNLNNTKP